MSLWLLNFIPASIPPPLLSTQISSLSSSCAKRTEGGDIERIRSTLPPLKTGSERKEREYKGRKKNGYAVASVLGIRTHNCSPFRLPDGRTGRAPTETAFFAAVAKKPWTSLFSLYTSWTHFEILNYYYYYLKKSGFFLWESFFLSRSKLAKWANTLLLSRSPVCANGGVSRIRGGGGGRISFFFPLFFRGKSRRRTDSKIEKLRRRRRDKNTNRKTPFHFLFSFLPRLYKYSRNEPMWIPFEYTQAHRAKKKGEAWKCSDSYSSRTWFSRTIRS